VATPVVIPHESVNDETVTLVSWLVRNGEWVQEGQAIASIETSKAIMEVNAPVTGFVQTLFEPGTDIPVGGILSHIHDEAKDCIQRSGVLTSNSSDIPVVNLPGAQGSSVLHRADNTLERQPASQFSASPDARTSEPKKLSVGDRGIARFSREASELLRQRGLDPATFAGRGLVRARDVVEYLREAVPSNRSGSSFGLSDCPPSKSLKATAATGVPVRTEKLSRRKRSEVASLAAAHHNTLVSSVSLMVPTRGLRAAVERHPEIKTNITAIVIYEASRLLRKFPHLNAFYADDSISFYEEVNIGFAVDGGRGLKVLVIRNTDTKGIVEIAKEMQESVVRYLSDDVPIELLAGGTFTVTDLSNEGVFTFSPLLNQGQSAILGVGSEFFPPGSKQGLFSLILSFDHQVSEGRQAAQFLGELRDRLKHYEKALESVRGVPDAFEEPYCSRCLRPAGELQEWDHFLLASLKPDGTTMNICSICLQGM